jgi:hypothetical protein
MTEEAPMAEEIGSLNPSEIAEAISAVKDQVVEAVEEARERFEIDRRIRENPWLVLGVAAGAGFVLGGGLWPTLRPLVKAAGRAALAPSNLLAIAAALGAMRAVRSEEEATPSDESKASGPVTH